MAEDISQDGSGYIDALGMNLDNLEYNFNPSNIHISPDSLYIDMMEENNNKLKVSIHVLGNELIETGLPPAPFEENDLVEMGDEFSFNIPYHKRYQFAKYLRQAADMIDKNTL